MWRSLLLMAVVAFAMLTQHAQAAPQASSSSTLCRYWSGSPDAGGIEILATGERTVGERAITGRLSTAELTIWSPVALRKLPGISSPADLILLMPAKKVEFRIPKGSDVYVVGDKTSFPDFFGKVLRFLKPTGHFEKLNSNRYSIDPKDMADLLDTDSIKFDVNQASMKLFEFPPSNAAGPTFRNCIFEFTNKIYTSAPGPVVQRAKVVKNERRPVDEVMPNFRARLLPSQPAFPSKIDIEVDVNEFGQISQCRLQQNLKLDNYPDVKPRICTGAARWLRFESANDLDGRPVPDMKIPVTLEFYAPCDVKLGEVCVPLSGSN